MRVVQSFVDYAKKKKKVEVSRGFECTADESLRRREKEFFLDVIRVCRFYAFSSSKSCTAPRIVLYVYAIRAKGEERRT